MKIAGFQNGSIPATGVAFAVALALVSPLRAVVPDPVKNDFTHARAAPLIIGEINDTPDPQRLAIYDKLYAKILAGLKG